MEGACRLLGDISEGRGLTWLLGGGRRIVLFHLIHHLSSPPPHPGAAAWLNSAPGNALGFLGTMPECGEERGNAVLPGKALLPIPFPRQREGNPLSTGLCPT